MRRRNFISFFFAFILLLVCYAGMKGQTVTSSPYSRFGIGEYSNKIFAQSAGMGGSYIALQNDTIMPLFINAANPASYSGLRRTTFEVSVNSTFNRFSSTASSSQSNNTMLDYIALGFPIGSRMGACVGVMPLSNVGYSINKFTTVENIGTVQEVYSGDGGVNQLYLGLSVAPFSKAMSRYKAPPKNRDTSDRVNYRKDLFTKHFLSSISIGGNANYNFGTINNTSRVLYPSQALYFNTARTTQSVVRGFSGNFGLQCAFTIDSVKTSVKDTVRASPNYGQVRHFKRELRQKVVIGLGYTYSMNSTLNTNFSDFAYTFLYQSNGINEYIRDTIRLVTDVNAPITLPSMHGIGVSLRKGMKLNVLADFETQLWSKFQYLNQGSQLKDMKRVSLGIEYIPKKVTNTRNERWKRTQFRAGVHYSDGNLMINNSNVSEYGVSVGLGLHVNSTKLSYNTFNISAEFGQIGTTENNLIQQKYIKLKLAFTFNDLWFLKYKYD
ncbi:MAG: hypothetical protein K0S33_1955 [Bacteroidetes bacterium]|jgi:hypothetical protein|nr:hypothetical protein [Bacteroidota bacterium]